MWKERVGQSYSTKYRVDGKVIMCLQKKYIFELKFIKK